MENRPISDPVVSQTDIDSLHGIRVVLELYCYSQIIGFLTILFFSFFCDFVYFLVKICGLYNDFCNLFYVFYHTAPELLLKFGVQKSLVQILSISEPSILHGALVSLLQLSHLYVLLHANLSCPYHLL